jgi:hypothetical protein
MEVLLCREGKITARQDGECLDNLYIVKGFFGLDLSMGNHLVKKFGQRALCEKKRQRGASSHVKMEVVRLIKNNDRES